MLLRRTALALASIALLLGACGDDDTSDGPTASTSATTDAAGGDSADIVDTVEIQDFAFGPSEFAAAPGATITFTNADSTAHTATAKDQSLFDTTSIAPGESATITVPSEPGTYEFFCAFHPTMVGAITVA